MNIKDGYALQLAVKKGYNVAIISGSISKPCAERFEYLGIRNVFMKVKDKEEVLAQFLLANHNLVAIYPLINVFQQNLLSTSTFLHPHWLVL